MKYVYPAVFTPDKDGGYAVTFPDVPRCFTCGNDFAHSIEMAEDVLAMMLCDTEDENKPIPLPSKRLICEEHEFITYIKADTDEWRRMNDNRAVRKNLTIPAWLNHKAEAAHVNFSGILQEALKKHLKITG